MFHLPLPWCTLLGLLGTYVAGVLLGSGDLAQLEGSALIIEGILPFQLAFTVLQVHWAGQGK